VGLGGNLWDGKTLAAWIAARQKALEALAEATGGATYFPRNVSEVERIATQVAHDIRNQYTIAYTPLNQAMDGSFRQIKVTVKAAGNPTVRRADR
jgi:VWFA-related protein